MEIGEPCTALSPSQAASVALSVAFDPEASDLQEVWDPVIDERPRCVARFKVTVEPDVPLRCIGQVEGPGGVARSILSASRGESNLVSVEWDGRGEKGEPVPPGKYKIRLRARAGETTKDAVSAEIRVVRVGVVAVRFGGKYVYPLQFAFKNFPASYDAADPAHGKIPDWQWKIASLDRDGKPRKPPPCSTGPSGDTATYCYPIAAKRLAKLAPQLRTAPVGFSEADGITLRLVESGTMNPWSDRTVTNIQPDKTCVFEAREDRKLAAGVRKTDVRFDFIFEYTNSKGKLVKLGRQRCSTITVYVLVSEPQNPWGRGSVPERQRPWVELLEKVCAGWARGTQTVEQAAGLVVEAVNGKMGLRYDTVRGEDRNKYTLRISLLGPPVSINLRKFLRNLAGDVTRKPDWDVVNCTVCGALVSTIANAVGCSVHSSIMGFNFGCHKIVAIGDTAWHHPFHQYEGPGDTKGSFSYHEVAWTGAAGASDQIYDACLKVAQDPVKSPATNPILPKGMTYATSNAAIDDYRRRLVVSSSVPTTLARQAGAGRYQPN